MMEITTKFIEDRYRQIYSNADQEWEDLYKNRRLRVYKRILRVLADLPIRSVVDVGASYGLMVDICNEYGLDAYGVDFPLPSIIDFHATLKHAKNKFIYGSIEDEDTIDTLADKRFDAVVILDSLRYFENAVLLNKISPRFFIIKEICDNNHTRQRRQKGEFDVRLYSPLSCSHLFPDYRIESIYASKHVASIPNPSNWMLSAYNVIFPTYTLVLAHQDK
jgi:SAM-dependent methyltransferase